MRSTSKELDKILHKKFDVLDKGFVVPIDYMGNDEAIVNAARCSYGEGTKKLSNTEGLIRYLMRHYHSTPFQMCELKLLVKMPFDIWRQYVRHRAAEYFDEHTMFSEPCINEYSTRYSVAIDDIKKTKPLEWRLQSKSNKQGSDGVVSEYPDGYDSLKGVMNPGAYLSNREEEFHRISKELYDERLEFGVAREQARKDLPLSGYTLAYWKIDLWNLLHFLALRMDSHAQKEIRDYATIIGEEIVAKWLPITWSAFNDYHTMRNALTLTAREIQIINAMNDERDFIGESSLERLLNEFGWLNYSERTGKLKRNRERQECENKFKKLGISIPW